MKRLACVLLVTLLATMFWNSPALARPAATISVSFLNGIEISQGTIVGNVRVGLTFVGSTTGALPGVFYTSVNYCCPPSPGANVTNTIVGGSWAVGIVRGGVFQGALFGSFISGTAVWNSTETLAAVTAALSITSGSGVYRGVSGIGSFSGTLSHATFPPTLIGSLTLSY